MHDDYASRISVIEKRPDITALKTVQRLQCIKVNRRENNVVASAASEKNDVDTL